MTVSVLEYSEHGPVGIIDRMPAKLLLGNDFLYHARCRINYDTNELERISDSGLKSTQVFVNTVCKIADSSEIISDERKVALVPQPDQLSTGRESACPFPAQDLQIDGCAFSSKMIERQTEIQSDLLAVARGNTDNTNSEILHSPEYEIIAEVRPNDLVDDSPESDDESPMYFPSKNQLIKTQTPELVEFTPEFWETIDINPNLTTGERQQIVDVLKCYPEVFPTPVQPIGHCKSVYHVIDTGDHQPVCEPLRPFSNKQTQIIEEKIQELLKMGAIYECDSEYSTNLLLVKKGEKFRLCQDLRPLNKITKKNPYPMPNIEELFQALHGSKIYSSIDLQQGYYNIEINPDDQRKTAFRVPGAFAGQYCWRRMVCGLTGAPATFCKVMDSIFRDLKAKSILNYIDDFLTFSENFKEHVKHLHEVCRRLRDAGLKINVSKCKFSYDEVRFVGNNISADGVKPSADRVEAVRNMSEPTTLKQLRSFLGLANWYRKFIQNFAHIADPLFNVCKSKESFSWGDEQEAAFAEIKHALCQAPILAHFDPSLETRLYTDASYVAVGSVLMQLHPEGEKLLRIHRNY